ncbi:hypothetical protein, partial [Kaistella sp.]|uniref:hypothetical protein n=1 Tax=Kaistella sp. TaxID=2782235 RepID=UPI003C34EBD8
MKSEFTFKSYFMLILLCAFSFLIYIIIPNFFSDPYYDDKLFPKIFIPGIIIFSFSYLLFGELRTKMIKVEIDKNEIIIKRFFGLKTETYKNSEINGWKYSHLSSRGGTYEYLYLYKNDKKIIKISEYYHKNYFQIKNEIQAKFK